MLLPSSNPPNAHITTICDRLSALNQVGLPGSSIKVKHKYGDMVSLLSSLWQMTGFSFTTEHVKAHQDESFGPLTLKVSLNCKMDALVKQIAIEHMSNPQHNISFNSTGLGVGTVKCKGCLI